MAKNDPSARHITELVKTYFFNSSNRIICGPNKGYSEYFPHVRQVISKDTRDVYQVVPDHTFHPQIAVSIDFTHTFVQTSRNEVSERVVDPAYLILKASKLSTFVKYYFENLQYDEDNNTFVDSLASTSREFDQNNQSEKEANKFVNEVINYFITSISVTRTRRQIGTASVIFKDTRNLGGKLGQDGKAQSVLMDHAESIFQQLFCPMLPITIWAKGRFYRDWYFPIFDGYITSVNPTDSEGFAELSINCKDVLELARISSEMINPALIVIAEDRKIDTINLQAKPFFKHDHMFIVSRLFVGGPLVYEPSNQYVTEERDQLSREAYRDRARSIGANTSAGNVVSETTKGADPGRGINLMRLENFTLYDFCTHSDAAKRAYSEKRALHKDQFNVHNMLNFTSRLENKRSVFLWGASLTPYRIWNVQSVDIFKSDFSSRLDVLNEVANMVYFDYYVDGGGNVWYHPHRMANTFLTKTAVYKDQLGETDSVDVDWPHVQVISPEESFTHNTLLNIEEMVTFLRLTGEDPNVSIEPELGNLVGSSLDRVHLKRFGYRRSEVNNPMFNYNPVLDADPNKNKRAGITFAHLAAASLLQYQNAELYTRESTIVFRPELEIAAPVFYTEDDTVFYVNSLTHNVSIGGNATTTINGSFGRKASETPNDMYNFIIQTEKLYTQYPQKNSSAEAQSQFISELLKSMPARHWERYLDNKALEAYAKVKENYKTTTSTPNSANWYNTD